MSKMNKKARKSKRPAFGMLSVKAGIDNNPKPTAADRIAGATKGKSKKPKAKKGAKVVKKKMVKKKY